MSENITIKRVNRRNMSMRLTPAGEVVVFIPKYARPDEPQVKQFIKQGLAKLGPHIPTEKRAPLHDAEMLRDWVAQWAARMELSPKRVTIRTMYKKWGSCSGKKNITLNTALYWLPQHLVEYVIVHELAHLKIMNHSKEFWALVGQYMPDYETYERELDGYYV